MKLDIVPESLLERLLASTGVVPVPLIHSMVGLLMSRALMLAAKFDVFEALSDGPLSVSDVAERCATDPRATGKLLRALEALGYVTQQDDTYRLTRTSRRWLAADSPHDLTDAILHRYMDLKLLDRAETYVAGGEAAGLHQQLSDEDWNLYVQGQKAHASIAVDEIVSGIRIPEGATRMLDVGGSHGLYSDAMCRLHPELRAVVLDLPEAIRQVDRTGISDRVSFQSGDVLTTEFGNESYDLVLMVNFNHHFGEEDNRVIHRKAARSLRPGGICVTADFVRPERGRKTSQFTALLDLYFGITSGGRMWTSGDIRNWMGAAGLKVRRPRPLRRVPDVVVVTGEKPPR